MKDPKKPILWDQDMKSEDFPAFTGGAYSVVCVKNNGHNNFKLVYLDIKEGKVVNAEYSIPLASFEAQPRIEEYTFQSFTSLSMTWRLGKAFTKSDRWRKH